MLPFTTEELLGRVNACLRRSPVTLGYAASDARIHIDDCSHQLFVCGEAVELSPTEFRLISFFLRHPGRMFSREELLGRAWPKRVNAGGRTVDVHVRRLRKILEPYRCENMIQTVRGFGYRFSHDDSTSRPQDREIGVTYSSL